jgi:glycosyltransferase involved in cell wall biosynthesis
MRIAQIAPIIERVPPKKYGGTERVVHALTEELVKRGHDVTLFASGDSLTTAHLKSIYPKGLRDARLNDLYGANHFSMLNIGLAYAMQDEFDIIHDHNSSLSIATANLAKTPVVMTMHGPFTPEVRRLFKELRKPYIVSISNAQARSAPELHYAGTVHNGLSMEKYPWSATHDGYLLFVGRISMEKGVHFAISTAQALDLPLIIAAKLEPLDRPYYQEYIEPYLSDQIRWIGEVEEDERNKLMSRALCFLHPVTWPEPFGLTLIESMACGTPVVAFSMGSIPEIIRNKKTGFVVHDLQGMIESVEAIAMIDRKRCRRYSIKNFSAYRMTNGYESIYQQILNKEI